MNFRTLLNSKIHNMKAKYIRVSTTEQNTDRQLVNKQDYLLYEDKISGLIPFQQRPAGKQLTNDILKGRINHVSITAIDRLGRNIVEIQHQLNWFISHRVQIFVENIQMNLLNNDGSTNLIAKMIIDLLGSVASLEIEAIKQRQKQGIAIAKAKCKYKGRKTGATMSLHKYLTRHKDVVALLHDGLSIHKTSKLTGKAFVTVKSVALKLEQSVVA